MQNQARLQISNICWEKQIIKEYLHPLVSVEDWLQNYQGNQNPRRLSTKWYRICIQPILKLYMYVMYVYTYIHKYTRTHTAWPRKFFFNFKILLFICSYIYVHTDTYGKVRGQPVRIGYLLLPCGSWGLDLVVRLGSKKFYTPSLLTRSRYFCLE